jgi:Fe-S-cluster containining protein
LGLPYYKKAEMRFECQYCGACCSTWQGEVYVHPADIPGLANAVGLLPGQFIQKYTRRDIMGHRHLVLKSNGYCIFYENGECIVNDVKPGACHAWPFWKDVCTRKRAWERAMKRCPGIGKGRVWTVEEIERRMALSP